jgi:hypothetical protein
MSIIGETIDGGVAKQISIRQNLHGKQTRTNTDLSILNNTNAWLKLASSVRVISQTEAEVATPNQMTDPFAHLNPTPPAVYGPVNDPSTPILEVKENNISGEQRLKDIGLTNIAEFTGNQLARKAVLFNTLTEVTPSTYNDKNEKTSQGSHTSRFGVSSTNSLWNNSSYGLGGTDFGIVPAPGLISAKIDCKNRGSIREATVELKAYNLFQFELIELLYLRLGYSMLLEWGWNKFLSNDNILQSMGNTLTEDLWFQDFPTYHYRKIIDEIARYRNIYSNNYDGFLGKVVNFDWSFQPDGTYNITLKLITIGDVIESLKVNLPARLTVEAEIENSVNENNKVISRQKQLSNLESPIVTNAGFSTLSLNLFKDIAQGTNDKWSKNQSKYFSWFLNLSDDNYTIKENKKDKDKYPPTGVNSNKYSYFLTFEELLNKINDLCVPTLNNNKMLEFDTGEDNICSVFPNQVSFNPKICLIKPAFTSNINISSPSQGETISYGVKNDYKSFAKLKDFFTVEENCATGANISYGKIMNIYLNYDFISNILQENTSKDGEISIFKFLEDICNGINSSLGGLNKLEPILEDDNIIKIIDQNPIPGIENSEEFGCLFGENTSPFEIFGYNPSNSLSSFVRDFGFKTKIGPELASMITIGAAAENKATKNYDGTAFSKWNDGLQDAYAFSYDDPKNDSTPTLYPPFREDQVEQMYNAFQTGPIDEYNWLVKRDAIQTSAMGHNNVPHWRDVKCPITVRNYWEVTWKLYTEQAARSYLYQEKLKEAKKVNKEEDTILNYVDWLIRAFGGKKSYPIPSDLYFYLNDDFYKMGKELFKGFITSLNNEIYSIEKNPSNTVGFIPADLSLTVDGLAGVKIYNALSINQRFLPKQYPKALKFIITKVNHNISNNNWETGLNTISVPNVVPPSKEFYDIALNNTVSSAVLDIKKSVKITGAEKIKNIQIIATYLKSIGISQAGATGLIGNIIGESQADPKAAEKNQSVGGLGGIGIVQWTSDRRRTLEKEFGDDNTKILDLNNQLNFLKKELETTPRFSTVFNQLKSSTNIADSTIIVLEKFEVPATYLNRNTDPNAYIATQQTRIGYANGAKSIVDKVYNPSSEIEYPSGYKF